MLSECKNVYNIKNVEISRTTLKYYLLQKNLASINIEKPSCWQCAAIMGSEEAAEVYR